VRRVLEGHQHLAALGLISVIDQIGDLDDPAIGELHR
jgi:hypothetical protein